jgi:hypothetical protein
MTETAGPDCRLRELARLRVIALSLSPLATATAEPRTIEARVVSPLAVAPLTRAESTRTDVRRSVVSLFDAFYTTKSVARAFGWSAARSSSDISAASGRSRNGLAPRFRFLFRSRQRCEQTAAVARAKEPTAVDWTVREHRASNYRSVWGARMTSVADLWVNPVPNRRITACQRRNALREIAIGERQALMLSKVLGP